MCEFCDEENGPDSCQDCGRLICFDEDGFDDTMSKAYVTGSGDLYCVPCGESYDGCANELEDEFLKVVP